MVLFGRAVPSGRAIENNKVSRKDAKTQRRIFVARQAVAAKFMEQLLFITKTRKNENTKKNLRFTFCIFVLLLFCVENGFCFNLFLSTCRDPLNNNEFYIGRATCAAWSVGLCTRHDKTSWNFVPQVREPVPPAVYNR
jgi:hypothetical protein